jgi:hypothetical protein
MRVAQRGCCCLWVLFVMCVCVMFVRGQSFRQQHRRRRGERSGPTSGRTDGPADAGVGVRSLMDVGGAGSGGACVQWGGVVMGVGAGTHTLLCVYVGVIVSQDVRVCCVGRRVLGGSVGWWEARGRL